MANWKFFRYTTEVFGQITSYLKGILPVMSVSIYSGQRLKGACWSTNTSIAASKAVAQTLLETSDDWTFTYYQRPEFRSVALNSILYFTSKGRKTYLVTSIQSPYFYQKLDRIEAQIEEQGAKKNSSFIRIHKSFLVNQEHIVGYVRKLLLLSSGEVLPISQEEYFQNLLSTCPQKRVRHFYHLPGIERDYSY